MSHCRWLIMFGLPVALAVAVQGQSRPADDDVMQPTQRGLRFNPVMADSFMKLWLREDSLWKKVGLDDTQKGQIAADTAERTMDVARRCGPEVRDGFEYLIETMMDLDGNLKKIGPERAREFGQKLQPALRAGREWFDGVIEDAKPYLNDQQLKTLENQHARIVRDLDRAQKALTDWAEGRYKEGEDPFAELGNDDPEPNRPSENEPMRQARQTAEWQVTQISRWDWAQLLAQIARMYKFTPEQQSKGEALLAAYRKRAEAVMTPEWRERALRNRMLSNAQWQLARELPKAPWQYRLEHEYEEMNRPLALLSDGLYQDLMALATPEQRAAAIGKIREITAKHGHTLDDLDLAAAGLLPVATQPATQP